MSSVHGAGIDRHITTSFMCKRDEDFVDTSWTAGAVKHPGQETVVKEGCRDFMSHHKYRRNFHYYFSTIRHKDKERKKRRHQIKLQVEKRQQAGAV